MSMHNVCSRFVRVQPVDAPVGRLMPIATEVVYRQVKGFRPLFDVKVVFDEILSNQNRVRIEITIN